MSPEPDQRAKATVLLGDGSSLPTALVAVPLEKLRRAPWNYKEDDAFLLEKLKANLRLRGQVENLCIRHLPDAPGLFEVINGNHRLDAFLDIRWDRPVWCFDFGEIPDALAYRIAVELNETRFVRSEQLFAGLVSSILDSFPREDVLSTLPLREPDLDWILAKAGGGPPPEERPPAPGPAAFVPPPPGPAVERLAVLTFRVTKGQEEVIRLALSRLADEEGLEGELRLSRALELLAADFLGGPERVPEERGAEKEEGEDGNSEGEGVSTG